MRATLSRDAEGSSDRRATPDLLQHCRKHSDGSADVIAFPVFCCVVSVIASFRDVISICSSFFMAPANQCWLAVTSHSVMTSSRVPLSPHHPCVAMRRILLHALNTEFLILNFCPLLESNACFANLASVLLTNAKMTSLPSCWLGEN